jgi:TolB-like protein/Tfp pilus assembly protein PilF
MQKSSNNPFGIDTKGFKIARSTPWGLASRLDAARARGDREGLGVLATANIFEFEEFRLDRWGEGLSRRNERGAFDPVSVGLRALDVLSVLVERPGELVTKEEIMAAVWGRTVVENANLTVQISALRRVLDQGRTEGSCIQTVAARGYRFVVAVARVQQAASQPLASRRTIDNLPGWREYHAAPRLSIVVLPFTNLTNHPDQQYFADGITEDLTTDLSRITDMLVISRNTAFTYKNTPIDSKQIGRELGVRYLLEGSVQRSGNRVRVTTQLIDAESDTHLWAERFDREVGDLFALQDDVTRRIAIALNLEIIGAEACRPTERPDALDYILRGRAASLRPPSREKYSEAINLNEQALALDPRSFAAQSYLATALTARVLDNMTDTASADIARAKAPAAQALASSPRSPLAHFAQGQVLRAQRRAEEAMSEYEIVIALNRNWVNALAAISWCKLYTGRLEQVVPDLEHAIRLSPRDPFIGAWYNRIGTVHLLQSSLDEATHWFQHAQAANPVLSSIYANRAAAHALKGETQIAAAKLAEARRLSSDDRYSSIARLQAVRYWGVPRVRSLFEATYLAGLRKAGVPEE